MVIMLKNQPDVNGDLIPNREKPQNSRDKILFAQQ